LITVTLFVRCFGWTKSDSGRRVHSNKSQKYHCYGRPA